MLYSCIECNWWVLIRTSYCWVSILTRTVVSIWVFSPQTPGGIAWLKRNTSVPQRYQVRGWPNWGRGGWETFAVQVKSLEAPFREEATHLSPKMKKKKKRTHGKYMAWREDKVLCITLVTTSMHIVFNPLPPPQSAQSGTRATKYITTKANQTQNKKDFYIF